MSFYKYYSNWCLLQVLRQCITTSNLILFWCGFWQANIQHIASAHPAVNGYMTRGAEMELVQIITTIALMTALYADLRVDIELETGGGYQCCYLLRD